MPTPLLASDHIPGEPANAAEYLEVAHEFMPDGKSIKITTTYCMNSLTQLVPRKDWPK